MAALTVAMMLTTVVGFLAGREYDRGIKRINENRRLRRAKEEKARNDARIRQEQETERQKNEFIYSVYYGASNIK